MDQPGAAEGDVATKSHLRIGTADTTDTTDDLQGEFLLISNLSLLCNLLYK